MSELENNTISAVSLWELADLRTPWCIHVVATLRVADFIDRGIERIPDLARSAGCDPGVLHAILDHLVSRGVFEAPEPGRFTLNPAARQFLDPMMHLSLDLDGIGGRFARAWGTLLELARTGQPAYAELFGLPFWEDLKAHPDLHADFDALIGPAGHGTPNPDFSITGGWQAIHTIVDVGGGTGAMLAEILRVHPDIKGILVDQPETVAHSPEIFQAAGVSNRAEVSAQSFFDPLPSGSDLYLLRGILNDWPDREALEILRRCAQAARPAGRVVVIKGILPDGARRDLVIEMVLLGGKQRAISEFRELAREAGLEVVAFGKQATGEALVECRPIDRPADPPS